MGPGGPGAAVELRHSILRKTTTLLAARALTKGRATSLSRGECLHFLACEGWRPRNLGWNSGKRRVLLASAAEQEPLGRAALQLVTPVAKTRSTIP